MMKVFAQRRIDGLKYHIRKKGGDWSFSYDVPRALWLARPFTTPTSPVKTSREWKRSPVAHMNADPTEETSFEVLRQTTRTVRTTQQVSETIMGTDIPYLLPDLAHSRHYSAWSSGSSFASSDHGSYWPQDQAAPISKAPELTHKDLPPLIVTLRYLDDPRRFTLPLDQQNSPRVRDQCGPTPRGTTNLI